MASLLDLKNLVSGKKTYLTGIAGICFALIAWSTDTASLWETGQAIFIALQTMFIRAGVAKSAA